MIALLYLFAAGVYAAVLIIATRWAWRKGSQRSRVWAFGFSVLAALLVILPVFWDVIPTWYTHRHLCETQAGLKVNMTPEHWAKENPEAYLRIKDGAVHEQAGVREREQSKNLTSGFLNVEFGYVSLMKRRFAFQTDMEKLQLVHRPTGYVLAEYIDFFGKAGKGSIAMGANSIGDYKIWTETGSCGAAYSAMKAPMATARQTFGRYSSELEQWGQK